MSRPDQPRLFARLAVVGLVLGCATLAAADPNPPDFPVADYRKLDEVLTFLRGRNSEQYGKVPSQGIAEARYVPIGGIDQWVTIRGADRNNPVLLFLHGGPGDSTNGLTFMMFAPWEKQFTVVQWDQRGAGRTLRKSGPSIAPTLTLDRMTRDGIELAEHLRKRLDKRKIVIVGHSFGTILGMRMARARPDLFYAYVGTGQVGDSGKNYAVAYDALLQKARSVGDQEAIDELTKVGPPPYDNYRGYGVQRKWANRFEGADRFLAGSFGLRLVAPGSDVHDVIDNAEGQMLSGQQLVPQTRTLSPAELGLEFAIPMFVLQGAEDFTTPTALARQFVAAIKAPRKELVLLEGAGHFAVFMKADQFLRELVQRVRPLATGR